MSKGMRNLIAINRVCQKPKRQLVVQLDYTYGMTRHQCWMWNGIGYNEGKALLAKGWIWQRGPQGGVWSTTDDTQGKISEASAIKHNIEIVKVGNGWGE